MVASLRSLLEGVFDYAGLFPPAKLDMSVALDKYIRHIQGKEEWIVSRFVCPAASLAELANVIDRRESTPEFPVTVIGHASTNYDEWLEALEQDAETMTSFMESVGDAASLEAFEVRLPSYTNMELCLKDLNAFSEVDVFLELPWGDGLEDGFAALAQTEWIGAKGRCGGLDRASFPEPDSLACFLHSAFALDVPIKLTAGLHHPLPGIDEMNGGRMHGFLNVLTAASLCVSGDMSRKELVEVLRDGSLDHWTFTDKGMGWRGHKVSIDEVEEMRDLCLGIGSCSIDEPIVDLTHLGLLTGDRP